MDAHDDLDTWTARLRQSVAATAGVFVAVHVVEEVDSTQDEARRRGLGAGHVLVARRQRAGRGRLGRSWHDTACDGIAVTMLLPVGPPERMALAAAVAAADAVDRFLPQAAGLKWPNDVVVEGRKVAGVLIEIRDGVAAIGVGINVSQRSWPPPLGAQAISLAQAGARAERVDVAGALVESMGSAMRRNDAELVAAFTPRCVLRGTMVELRCGAQRHLGEVVRVDPLAGVALRTATGVVHLPAAHTSVVGWSGLASGEIRSQGSPL